MAKLTLGNPVAGSTSAAVSIQKACIDTAGRCLSSGKVKGIDVVADFIASSLGDKALILGKINNNISYSINALKTSQNSLATIGKTLTEMIAVVAQSTGNSKENRATLNDILQQKIKQVQLQTQAAEFDERKLLDGSLGSDPTVTARFDTKTVSVKNLANGTNFAAAGTKGRNTLTVGANTAAGEVVQFGGQKFTIVSTKPSKEGEVQLGSTVNETARNLATAMTNSTNEGLKGYTVSASGATVIVDQIAASVAAIPLQGSTNITNVVTTAGTTGGIDLSGIRDIAGFIKSPVANFTLISHAESAGGDAAAKTLGTQFGNATAVAANSADGDRAAAYRVNIGGKEFTGAVFYANGGDLQNAVLKMSHADTNESFTLTFGGAYAGTDIDSAANAGTLASTELSNLFKQSQFNQTRVLKVNTDVGDTYDSKGNRIGSTKGMTVNMTSTGFDNKKFTDVLVEQGTNAGDVKFTIKATGGVEGDQTFELNVLAANIGNLVQGNMITLTDSASGDTINLNIGEAGLTSVSDVKNHEAIQTMLKDAFLQKGMGLDVRVGIDFADQINVSIKDISASKIYVDNNGTYISDINILDETAAAQAQEVLQNALKKIRAEEASVQTQIESVSEAADALRSTIEITQDSERSYSEADLIEHSQAFSDAIKKITAAVSALQAGNRISDAAQQLLQGLAR